MRKNQKGSSAKVSKEISAGFAGLELILILVIVAALGLVSYRVYKVHHDRSATASQSSSSSLTPKTTESSSAAPVNSVPDVTQKSDLDAADKALDQNDNNADANDQAILSGQENDY